MLDGKYDVLEEMYEKFESGDIFLWCDADVAEVTAGAGTKRKRKRDEGTGSTRKLKEEDVDTIFQALKEKHGSSFTVCQLRLWARMLHCGTHDSHLNPPPVPMFAENVPKRQKRESLSEVISEAVVAVRKAFTPTEAADSGPSKEP